MMRKPRPRLTMVDTAVGADGAPVSLITRIWPRTAGGSCSLCPRCNAQPMLIASVCVVATPGFIGNDEAALHRFNSSAGDAFPEFGEAEQQWAELVEDD